MRRSKAPSMVNKNKRLCDNFRNSPVVEETHGSDPEDESSLNWGSKNNPSVLGRTKRVFNIVWRDVSNKKHKTWKGDGSMEVNLSTMKAILKDEKGNYLGSTTRFKLADLIEDYQMVVSGKEIEIQNEIKDEDEFYELRKKEITNRNWGSEEWASPEERAEEQKKPKGGFYFKPILVLKSPKISRSSIKTNHDEFNECEATWGTSTNKMNSYFSDGPDSSIYDRNEEILKKAGKWVQTSTSTALEKQVYQYQSLICFVKPSELQQYLFQQINEYYAEIKKSDNCELNSLNIPHILEQICNHPSFLKHITQSNDLVQYLASSLPIWSEMGPFDSGKLEFIQYFMQPSPDKRMDNLVLISKSLNSMNMLHGLCDFMNITCLRLNNSESEASKKQTIIEYLKKTEENERKVLLLNDILNLKENSFTFENEKIIVFENVAETMMELKKLTNLKLVKIYFLITAFSIEELLFTSNELDKPDGEMIDELLNLYKSEFDDNECYTHSKMECKCHEQKQNNGSKISDKFKMFKHLIAPFDEQFLKEASLENSTENLITIFSATNL
ncbi:uncharacterized protein LOC142222475 [Haematobia irritans]|uniref:uncharacterized protein LOC142222475 n=1 Tax=Haematobia irritans TaxID=7368 RepID=UPI003F50AE6E